MDAQFERLPLKIHRVLSSTEPEFAALVRIYTEAHPESERKSIDRLSRMMERPEYIFLTVSRDGLVVGFSISICFVDSDAALLEYMAVAEAERDRGIGQFLFNETVKFQPMSERYVLIEVDSDKILSADHQDRVRRKKFYRRLGCREIEGLTYLMPRVSSATPPPMDLFIYKQQLPPYIEKSRLRTWLEDCYSQVYQMPRNDHRIDSMLANLPDKLTWI